LKEAQQFLDPLPDGKVIVDVPVEEAMLGGTVSMQVLK
jgi:hypothetical protein